MAERTLAQTWKSAKQALITNTSSYEHARKKYGEIKTYFRSSAYLNPVGIEVEVEKSKTWRINMATAGGYYWRIEEDGSLKKDGTEFISVPLFGACIDYAIHELELTHPSPLQTQPEFSHRTSIHVHVNVSDYTRSKLVNLVALYGLYEDAFFSLCDPIRKHNCYAYPMTSLCPTKALLIDENAKYCALNLAPIRRQLTVEFRGLHGTNDFRLIRRWVQICAKLVSFVQREPTGQLRKRIRDAIINDSFGSLNQDMFGGSLAIFGSGVINESVNKHKAWSLATLEA